jgi:MFS family permease
VVFVDQAQPALGPPPVAPQVAGRRFVLTSAATAKILGAVAAAELALIFALNGLDHQFTVLNTWTGVGFLFFAAVGALVVLHQPRNAVGWLLLGFSSIFLLGVCAQYYAVFCYHLGHRGLPLAPVAVLVLPIAQVSFVLLPLVILLFPDGRLPSPGWRWVLWSYAVLSGVLVAVSFAPAIAAVASHDVGLDASGSLTTSSDLPGWVAHPPVWLYVVTIVVPCLSFVAYQAISWRKAAGERREQIKWLAAGGVATIGLGLTGGALTSGLVSWILGSAIVGLPVGIGVGILKYRLYDIDRIISRTLAYALVTGLLIGVYAGLVLLITHLFRFHTPVAVAAATLAAAALFNPLRRRVQRAVDRRFNRARYDADQTVTAFAARLKDAVDLDSVRDDLAAVVGKALEPVHMSVWINPAG